MYIYRKLNLALQVLNSVLPVQVSDTVFTGIGWYRYRPLFWYRCISNAYQFILAINYYKESK